MIMKLQFQICDFFINNLYHSIPPFKMVINGSKIYTEKRRFDMYKHNYGH